MIAIKYPVLIHALVDSPRSHFLFTMPELYEPLLEYSVSCLTDVFPCHKLLLASDMKPVIEFAHTLGLKTLSQNDVSQASGPTILRGITVRPHLGPLSPMRIRYVLAVHKKNRRPTVSAMLVHPNCNPTWLQCIDSERTKDNIGTVENKQLLPLASECRNQREGETTSLPKGSQWLPKVYIPDYAVTINLCGSEVPGSLSLAQDDPKDYSDTPLFYRLPFFWLHKETWPEMVVKNEIFQELLLPPRQYNKIG